MFTDTVGVSPLNVNPKHYGTAFTMSNFESKVHNLYITANFLAMEDLRLYGAIVYNKAQAALDEVIMPEVESLLGGDLEDQDFTFAAMPTYSDLDYELLNLQLGFEYKLSPEVTWTADGIVADLWDYAAYVFGDETGSYFVIRSGLRLEL